MEYPNSKHTMFLSTLSKWVFWGIIIGVIVGSTSALLLNLNDFITGLRFSYPWLIFFLPLGGIVIGYIYEYHGKNSYMGNDLILDHIHYGQVTIPLRMGPIVFISTFITHLFGGSAGREAAAIQMGTSISEGVNRIINVGKIDRRILVISGISGGFGSGFGTPLTGTIFGMEVIAVGKMKYEALIPCFTASFVGHFTTQAWGVAHEEHIIQTLPEITTMNMANVILLSIIFGLTSVLYSELRHYVQKTSNKHFENNMMLRTLVGGIKIIILTFILGSFNYLGRGLPIVNEAFEGTIPFHTFFLKIIFTAITIEQEKNKE